MLAKSFVELADTLFDDFDIAELLGVLVERCVDVLDVGAAGVLLWAPDRRPWVMASSTETARDLDVFQAERREGPCVECVRTGDRAVDEDLASADARWPSYAARALSAGFRSAHALPLRLRETVIGALSLLHVDAGRMRPADLAAGQAMADVATIAVLHHRAAVEARELNARLGEAVDARNVIEQAAGVVAEHEAVDVQQASFALRRYARSHDVVLHALARDIVDRRVDPALLDAR